MGAEIIIKRVNINILKIIYSFSMPTYTSYVFLRKLLKLEPLSESGAGSCNKLGLGKLAKATCCWLRETKREAQCLCFGSADSFGFLSFLIIKYCSSCDILGCI